MSREQTLLDIFKMVIEVYDNHEKDTVFMQGWILPTCQFLKRSFKNMGPEERAHYEEEFSSVTEIIDIFNGQREIEKLERTTIIRNKVIEKKVDPDYQKFYEWMKTLDNPKVFDMATDLKTYYLTTAKGESFKRFVNKVVKGDTPFKKAAALVQYKLVH